MAGFSGTAGSVTVGTVLLVGMSEWSLDISMSPVETTDFGENWDTFVPSTRAATGSFSGNFQLSDTGFTTLQNSILGGSVLALRCYMNSTKYWNIGTAYITGFSPTISQKGKAETSFNFQSSGPITLV
jgi:hypothetical protein